MFFASVPGSHIVLVCNHPPVTAALHKPVSTSDTTSTEIGLAKLASPNWNGCKVFLSRVEHQSHSC